MGTNYYIRGPICPTCGGHNDTLPDFLKPYAEVEYRPGMVHIGKSSAGWTFSFRGYKTNYDNRKPIETTDDWAEIIDRACAARCSIINEYGRKHSPETFWKLVWEKKGAPHNYAMEHPKNSWVDRTGSSFTGDIFF
jgi:hypothetical protein